MRYFEEFEAGRVGPEDFDHRAHVRLAHSYVTELPLLDAVARCCAALQDFATRHGAPDKFHVTITVGFVLLIAERARPEESFPKFEARNPDLFEGIKAIQEYYPEPLLSSDHARSGFIVPTDVRPGSPPPPHD